MVLSMWNGAVIALGAFHNHPCR